MVLPPSDNARSEVADVTMVDRKPSRRCDVQVQVTLVHPFLDNAGAMAEKAFDRRGLGKQHKSAMGNGPWQNRKSNIEA
jgi:hypothetical protein